MLFYDRSSLSIVVLVFYYVVNVSFVMSIVRLSLYLTRYVPETRVLHNVFREDTVSFVGDFMLGQVTTVSSFDPRPVCHL